jgi:hypothetical protein
MTKLIGLSAIAVILSTAGADAQHRPAYVTGHYGIHRLSPTADRGWRLRSNAIGWDPSCFDINLPSMFACSAN